MKIIAIIQARMSSSRLPGKILAPLAGYPLLEVIQNRIKSSAVDSFWLATSSCKEDDVTEFWGHELGFNVYRGDMDDVLSRFVTIIKREPSDWVIRLTADNPFIDAGIINKLIEKASSVPNSVGYIYENEPKTLPLGYVPEIVRPSCLFKAESQISEKEFSHRVHVTSWIKKNTICDTLDIPENWKNRCQWRWTIDTDDDYKMASKAFDLFGSRWSSLQFEEMVDILDNYPEIMDINKSVQQKGLKDG